MAALLPLVENYDPKDKEGNTPLHLAVGFGWTRIVRKLVIAGCDYSI